MREPDTTNPCPCFYFQVHQPYRLVDYDFFRIGEDDGYENEELNEEVFSKVAEKCYLPATRLFRQLVERSGGRFRFALSFTGVVLEQMERFRPDVLEEFQKLAETGAVEILGETYYHSLASLYSREEFERQVELHQRKVAALFGVQPRVFRNTELVYSNQIAVEVEKLGFDGIVAEGVPWLLWGKSTNYLAMSTGAKAMKTLLRNPGLSDDLGFRFSDPSWKEFPVTGEKYLGWIRKFAGDLVNVCLDFESFGEHQGEECGIFAFWADFVSLALEEGVRFVTPSEAIDRFDATFVYDCNAPTSWADRERDLSAWIGNIMQQEAALKIHAIEPAVIAAGDESLIHAWSKLQTSDHFHHMSTKGGTDGKVHGYFSPYRSPYDAYIFFMNALADLQIRVNSRKMRRASEVPLVEAGGERLKVEPGERGRSIASRSSELPEMK